MASVIDALVRRVNPRLTISISIVLTALVPLAFLVELLLTLILGGADGRPVMDVSGQQVVGAPDVPALSHYQEAVRGRHLFRAPVEKAKKKVKTVTIRDLAKNLELIGVIELDRMEAIIKDKRSRQSYYVNEGSEIGELAVQSIKSNKVVLAYKDETLELQIT